MPVSVSRTSNRATDDSVVSSRKTPSAKLRIRPFSTRTPDRPTASTPTPVSVLCPSIVCPSRSIVTLSAPTTSPVEQPTRSACNTTSAMTTSPHARSAAADAEGATNTANTAAKSAKQPRMIEPPNRMNNAGNVKDERCTPPVPEALANRIVRGMVFVFAAHSCDDAMLQGSGDDRGDRQPWRDGERGRCGLPCEWPARRRNGRRPEQADTQALAAQAGLELVADLDAVVASADLVLSIAPPDQARAIAADLVGAAARTGARPLVSDWNAVSPATARELGDVLAGGGLELVDGSISGGPPRADYRTRVYVSGARAAELAESGPPWLDLRVVGAEVGLASAVKMCTASVYKGHTALLAHALATAQANGVLAEVLDDLRDSFPRQIERAARLLAVSTTKAGRYVGEMREIAATQAECRADAGAVRGDGGGVRAARRDGARGAAPESIPPEPELEDVLERLTDAGERT